MKRQRYKNQPGRNCSGQGIIESAVALIIIAMTLVAGIAFLCDLGTFVCYKIKLAGVADAASQYAADQTYWMGVRRPTSFFSDAQIQSLTNTDVQQLLTSDGLRFTSVSSPITADATGAVCTVTLTVNDLPLPFSLGLLPKTISDTEIAATPYPNDLPISTTTINWTGYTNPGVVSGIILPSYGMYVGTAGGYTDMTATFAGTPPTSGAHNPYPGSNFPYWYTTVYQSGPGGP